MRRHLPFLLAAAVPFLILLGMTADQARVVHGGREIAVKVIPVDPMSFFSGEYARLSYEFSSMSDALLEKMGAKDGLRLRKGDRVWVILAPGGDGLWHPSRLASAVPDNLAENEVAVRGEVRHYPPTLSLHTGLESFFVPQGEAARLERTVREGEVTAILSVLPNGRAAVRKLLVKGREVSF